MTIRSRSERLTACCSDTPPHTLKPATSADLGASAGSAGSRAAGAASGVQCHCHRSDEPSRIRVQLAQGRHPMQEFKGGARCEGRHARIQRGTRKRARSAPAIWAITGKRDVDIVFEHPGEETSPACHAGGEAWRLWCFCAGHTGTTSLRLRASVDAPDSASRARISRI